METIKRITYHEASLRTNAFKKYSLEESIRAIADIGYDGVEILCDIPHAYPVTLGDKNIQSIIEQVANCNIQISNLNAFTLYAITDVYHPSWIENEKELRQFRLQHTINCIHLAKKIGAKNLSTEPGDLLIELRIGMRSCLRKYSSKG